MIFSIVYSVPYFLMFLILFWGSIPLLKDDMIDEKTVYLEKQREVFVLFLFFIFVAFRGYVYSDCLVYHDYYSTVPTIFDGKYAIDSFLHNNVFFDGEYLFLIWSMLFKSISDNYLVWQTLSTLVDLCLFDFIFRKYIPNSRALGFLVFFVFYGFIIEVNLLRNVKAILIFLFSIGYIRSRSFFKYLLSIIVAMLFHISAVFYLPLYFMLTKRIKKEFILGLVVVGNIITLFKIVWIKPLLFAVGNYIPGALGDMLNTYLYSDYASSSYSLGLGFLERDISFFIFYSIFAKSEKEEEIIFFNLFSLYILVFLYCSEMKILVERIPYLFAPAYWILYPLVYEKLNYNTKKYFLLWLFMICGSKIIVGNSNYLTRYDNILWGAESYQIRREVFNTYAPIFFLSE